MGIKLETRFILQFNVCLWTKPYNVRLIFLENIFELLIIHNAVVMADCILKVMILVFPFFSLPSKEKYHIYYHFIYRWITSNYGEDAIVSQHVSNLVKHDGLTLYIAFTSSILEWNVDKSLFYSKEYMCRAFCKASQSPAHKFQLELNAENNMVFPHVSSLMPLVCADLILCWSLTGCPTYIHYGVMELSKHLKIKICCCQTFCMCNEFFQFEKSWAISYHSLLVPHRCS